MDMMDRLLAHDAWTTERLLEIAARLPKEALDCEFDIGLRTLRRTFDHVIHNVEAWSAELAGEPWERATDRTIAGMIERLRVGAARLARVARDVRDHGGWDELWSPPDAPDVQRSYGGTIAHVITHSMHHRAQILYLLRLSGVTELPEGDVLSWESAVGPAITVAERLAGALDAEDYSTVTSLLHDECLYSCRGETYRGPEAIVDSYRAAGDGAEREFDEVRYESDVRGIDERTAAIRFVDHLERSGERLTFECEQIVTIDGDRVVRIEHVDLPGRREALAAFRARTSGAGERGDEPPIDGSST